MSSTLTLNSYRNLLRVVRNVFHKDPAMKRKATLQARQKYLENRTESDPNIISKKIQEAYETASFLEKNVMQVEVIPGKSGSTNRYKGKVLPRHEMFDQFEESSQAILMSSVSHKCCSKK